MPRSTLVPNTNGVRLLLRVRYAETDQMQRAYYGRYLEWFEAARAEFCRARGIEYARMESERGLFIPVLEAHCYYHAPARYDDEIEIYAYIAEIKSRTLRFGYLVRHGDTKVAEGETSHILVDKDGRPRVWPADIAALFAPPEI